MSSFSIPPIKQSPLIGLEGFNGGASSIQNNPKFFGFQKVDDYDNYEWTGDPIEVIGDWTQDDLDVLPTDRLFYLTFDMYDSPTTTKTIAAVGLVNSISGYSSQTNGNSGGDAYTYDGLPDGKILSLSIFAGGDATDKMNIAMTGSSYDASGDSTYAVDDNDCNVMNHKGDLIQMRDQYVYIPLFGSSTNANYACDLMVYRNGSSYSQSISPDSSDGFSNCIGHPEVSSNSDAPPNCAVYIPFPAVEKALYGWSGQDVTGQNFSYREGYKITDATQVTGDNTLFKGIHDYFNDASDSDKWKSFNWVTSSSVANKSVILTDGIGSFIIGHAGYHGAVYHEVNYKTGQLVNSRTFKMPEKMGHNDASNTWRVANYTEEDPFGDVLLAVNATTFHGYGLTGTISQRIRFGGRDGWRHPDRAYLERTTATGSDSFEVSAAASLQSQKDNDQSGRDYIGMVKNDGTVTLNTWGHDDHGIFGSNTSHNDNKMGFHDTNIRMLMKSNVTGGTINKTFYTDTSAYG